MSDFIFSSSNTANGKRSLKTEWELVSHGKLTFTSSISYVKKVTIASDMSLSFDNDYNCDWSGWYLLFLAASFLVNGI